MNDHQMGMIMIYQLTESLEFDDEAGSVYLCVCVCVCVCVFKIDQNLNKNPILNSQSLVKVR